MKIQQITIILILIMLCCFYTQTSLASLVNYNETYPHCQQNRLDYLSCNDSCEQEEARCKADLFHPYYSKKYAIQYYAKISCLYDNGIITDTTVSNNSEPSFCEDAYTLSSTALELLETVDYWYEQELANCESVSNECTHSCACDSFSKLCPHPQTGEVPTNCEEDDANDSVSDIQPIVTPPHK